jgi:hypothetical protein
VLPTDVHYCAPRVVAYTEEDAQTVLADALDLLDEARDVALARSIVYQRPSSPATSSFVSSKQARRSWSHHGEAHISSTKPSQKEHIGYTTPK